MLEDTWPSSVAFPDVRLVAVQLSYQTLLSDVVGFWAHQEGGFGVESLLVEWVPLCMGQFVAGSLSYYCQGATGQVVDLVIAMTKLCAVTCLENSRP